MTIAGKPLRAEERSETRECVFFRTRLIGSDGVEHPATLVNMSPSGFMVRCETEHASGERITVMLPRHGRVVAEVRWSLGGRIGCQLERLFDLADYHMLIQMLSRG